MPALYPHRLPYPPREQGTYFEELIVCFLENEPAFRELYATVQTYATWAKRHGFDGRDTGIDLVAETVTGDAHAIQCKMFAPDHRVQKSEIDSFFTASGKNAFSERIIVSTTNKWSVNAEAALLDQNPPVVVKAKKALRSHQQTALSAVRKGFETSDRGKLIMACGTGKTFTSLMIAETLAGEGKHVLFLVPSLALLSQTLTEWTQESDVRLHSFAACSDGEVGKSRDKNSDTVETLTHELHYPATTDAARLAWTMNRCSTSASMS